MKSSSPIIEESIKNTQLGSTNFANFIGNSRSTSKAQIIRKLDILNSHKKDWKELLIDERILLLSKARDKLFELKEKWVATELKAKGNSNDSFPVAEEWVILAHNFRTIQQVMVSLKDIAKNGKPSIRGEIISGKDNRTRANIFPSNIWDRLIFQGVKGEAWFQDGINPEDVIKQQASRYRDKTYTGGISLVLGGGNAGMLPLGDTLHKMFLDLHVVILKMNPVNEHLGPFIEECFDDFIQKGFFAVVYGGKEIGSFLCNHQLVDDIHMTGSNRTYEAIVFGPGKEGVEHKLGRKPRNTKPFTAELGNVSPVIVVPGPWKEKEVSMYAEHIATWITANAGYGCNTPRVIIQQKSWPQSEKLKKAIVKDLEGYPTRKAFYPGARKIHEDFLKEHPDALTIGNPRIGHIPWTICQNLDPENENDICFQREGFGGITSEVQLNSTSVPEFLDDAVEFANHTLWGSLCATLVIHPKSYKDAEVSNAIERAISNLRYGTIALNIMAFYSSYLTVCPWGAYPGHDIYDIQSGIGKNYNFLMLENVEKVVLRAPFKRLDPLTIGAKRPEDFARKLAAFEAYPGWLKLVSVLISALRN